MACAGIRQEEHALPTLDEDVADAKECALRQCEERPLCADQLVKSVVMHFVKRPFGKAGNTHRK